MRKRTATKRTRGRSARRGGRRAGGPLLLAGLALLLTPLHLSPAEGLPAHDEAVIESDRSSVPAGGALEIRGKDFTGGESHALRLEGALREYDLGDVEPGDDGTFTLDLEIPRDVVPGAYQVVAVAGDGDVVARYDLQVLAPDATAQATGEGHEPASHGETAARSDEIHIERDRSGVEWGAIGLLVGLAGGLGVGLLRRGDRRPPGAERAG